MNLPDDEKPTLLTIIGLLIAMALTNAAELGTDAKFNSALPEGSTIHSIVTVSGGGVLVGGSFTANRGQNLALLGSTGQSDPSLSTMINGPVLVTATDPSGRLVVGGAFSTVNDAPAQNLARLLPNGQLDSTFSPAFPNGRVRAIKVLADGRLLVAGDFTKIGSGSAIYLACLNSDGTLDSAFQSSLQSSFAMEAGAYALGVQPDGKILVGGTFEVPGATSTLVRLNPEGTIDSSFAQDNGSILYLEDIYVADDGSIFICGMSTPYADGFIRKLRQNGGVAEDFTEAFADGPVRTISVSDGGILVGGDFSQVNGQARGNLARLLPDGEVDGEFDISTDGPVEGLAALEEHVYVAGNFSMIGDVRANSIARLQYLQVQSTGTVSRTFHSVLPGTLGKTYVIECSTDLVTWSDFATQTATEEGVEVLDTALKENVHRFFRSREVQ